MRRHLLTLALGLWAAAPALAAAPAPVRLEAPRAGETLEAGATAELAWSSPGGLNGFEEWEAFLSLDGGRTYPVRITPHLDRGLRRVRWQVPAFPTADARLLLRFGDERRETAVELPQRFAIAERPGAPLPLLPSPAAAAAAPGVRVVPSRGEPARPGEPGVTVWVEGDRQGRGLRAVAAALPPSLGASFQAPDGRAEAAVLAPGVRDSGPAPAAEARGAAALPRPRASARTAAARAPLPPPDILLLVQRQNE